MTDSEDYWPSQQNLLLISDLPASNLQEKLEDFGYKFVTATNNEAIEKAMEEHNTQVAFLDAEKIADDALNLFVGHIKQINPETKVIALYKQALGKRVQEILKAGVDEILQIPFDEELVINLTFQYAPIAIDPKSLTLDSLVIANVMEINNKKPLPFDVFIALPANKKVIKYRAKGHAIDERTIEKAKNIPKFHVYILKSDMSLYRDHCAEVLKQIYDDPAIPKAERTEKVKKQISNLMRGYFSEEPPDEKDQRQMVSNIRSIVEDMEDESGSKKELKKQVMELAAEYMTNYSHSQNVATYCALFGQILGINEPESLIMGGAIHDIGMSDLPSEIVGKDIDEMNEKEVAQYKLHPGNARYAVMEQKMKLPDEILKMILQHHEHSDGSGFPYGIKADEIHPFAKICAFADYFDKLTSLRYGHKQMSPLEAVHRISGADGKPAEGFFDPDFHGPIVNYFENLETEIDVEDQMEESEEELLIATEGKEVDYEKEHGQKKPVKGYVMEAGEIEDKKEKSVDDLLTDMAGGEAEAEIEDLETAEEQAASIDVGELETELAAGNENESDMVIEMEDVQLEELNNPEDALAAATSKNDPNLPSIDVADGVQAHGSDLPTSDKVHKHVDNTKSSLDVNSRNKKGQTLLMHAAANGNTDTVVRIIELGGDVNAKDYKGFTSLMFAARGGHSRTVQFLLRHKADINARDSQGRSPLVHAIEGGHRSIVQSIIVKGGRTDTKNNGMTPLMLAAFLGDASIVAALLEGGANAKLKDIKGHTAVHYAMAKKNREAAAVILKYLQGK